MAFLKPNRAASEGRTALARAANALICMVACGRTVTSSGFSRKQIDVEA